MLSLDQLLQESERIEPVPQVVHQLMDLADDPDVPVSEITELIFYEPVITANLLKLANSAAFGFKKKVDSVQDAVVMLGLKRVVELALLASVTKSFRAPQAGYVLSKGQLWKQSVSCALMASTAADTVDASIKHIVFTAALLKDIGVIVMDPYMHKAEAEIKQAMQTDHLDLVTAERRILGIDHAHLGGQIARNWHFSDALATTIQDHHLIDASETVVTETAMVYLADCMCSLSGINGALFCSHYEHYDRMLKQLGLTETMVNRMMSDFYSQKDNIYGLLAIL
ncbi:HDOD domain-containing protein [Desulfosarcina ovata]|uniref:Phosphodiesterase n=1 Tax=Desulfosarcina ovata subsp. ovata TaxID=2752305 RepID=A0A5K8AGX6_9BACT|nr:HDOD domain-containing protein [Desulfosarcina ovata]BBO91110.1 phosphodiesterase [Desulfosarcina ovata subsp. ovata]